MYSGRDLISSGDSDGRQIQNYIDYAWAFERLQRVHAPAAFVVMARTLRTTITTTTNYYVVPYYGT